MLYRIEFADQVRVEGKDVDAVCDHATGTLTVRRTTAFSLQEIVSAAIAGPSFLAAISARQANQCVQCSLNRP
jgi:hypothetical protein